jgi:peroxin-11B
MSASKQKHLDLSSFLALLESTQGRDKFSKLLQYASKLTAWYLLSYQPEQKDLAGRLGKLEKGTANARKLFRLLRPIAFAKKVMDLASKGGQMTVSEALQLGTAAGYGNYFFADHFLWLIRLGVIKGDENYYAKWSSYGWLIALCFALTSDLLDLLKYLNKSQAVSYNTPPQELAQLKQQRQKLTLNFTKNVSDLCVSLSSTKLTTFPDWWLGICGISASLVGFYELWPQK